MRATEAIENQSAASTQFDRRHFLVTASLAGGALLLKCAFRPDEAFASDQTTAAKVIPLNAWLKIGTDDSLTIIVSQAEMGQGIRTTLPAVITEELGADWSRVRLEESPTDPAYRNPRVNWQFTGNSESTPSFFDLMRQMGASAREMLIGAAAQNGMSIRQRATPKRAKCSTRIRAAARNSAIWWKPPRKSLLPPSLRSKAKGIGRCSENRSRA